MTTKSNERERVFGSEGSGILCSFSLPNTTQILTQFSRLWSRPASPEGHFGDFTGTGGFSYFGYLKGKRTLLKRKKRAKEQKESRHARADFSPTRCVGACSERRDKQWSCEVRTVLEKKDRFSFKGLFGDLNS